MPFVLWMSFFYYFTTISADYLYFLVSLRENIYKKASDYLSKVAIFGPLGDKKCQLVYVSPLIWREYVILRRESGLTSNIIRTLVAVLFLAMLLTVFVMDVFWQRDLVRNFADHAETVVSILLQEQELQADQLSKSNGQEWQGQVLRKSGALAGVLLEAGGTVIPLGQINGYEHELQQWVEKSLSSQNTHRTLFGFSWNILVPAKKYLILAQPFPEARSTDGAIALLYPLDPVYVSMRQGQRLIFVYLLVNLIVLTVIGLFRFVRFTVRPLEQLVRLTDAYEEEGAVPFLTIEQGNELGQLSSALHQMLQRIEEDKKKLRQNVLSLEAANNALVATREEMVRAEKLASVGRLAAGLAHEIGNPIGVVQGYLGLLQQDDLTSEERKDFAYRSDKELERINRLVRQLLDFSRAGSELQEEVSIHSILGNLVEMISCQPFMTGIEIKTDLAASGDVVLAGADQLQQVFFNCLLNAADAINTVSVDDPIVYIRTVLEEERSESNKKNCIQVQISDTGAGIAEDDSANIFDPFFTTKEPGKGTGLGLSVAYSIVERYGGTMRVESRLGEGTTMFVELPLVEQEN